ncbi:MAG: LacI family DNA-binding transcriptional regulator [bacterium]|nr:LacI family DNA-binding transcriptional regulator [bacterium]
MSENGPVRAPNIFDVARLAGVSHQTVSRVLNGLPNVRPATRERVERAILQLKYSPSPQARALVTKRTRTLGLIIPSVPDHGPNVIAMHFNIAARAARYRVDMVSAVGDDPRSVRSTVEALLGQRVDGIVLVVMDNGVLEMVRGLELSVPVVAAASTQRRSPILVSIDQYRGARLAVRHLAELGHHRILHMMGPTGATDSIERVRGWRDELAEWRLSAPEPMVGDWTADSGFQLGREIEVEPGSAVFASNDLMAMGLMSALRERGLSVPGDVSVVGFDDVPEAAYLYPPLTTIRQDFAALGELMMQKILIALEEHEPTTSDTPMPTRLVVRDSTSQRFDSS